MILNLRRFGLIENILFYLNFESMRKLSLTCKDLNKVFNFTIKKQLFFDNVVKRLIFENKIGPVIHSKFNTIMNRCSDSVFNDITFITKFIKTTWACCHRPILSKCSNYHLDNSESIISLITDSDG